MKKVIGILCVMGLLLGVATSAMASETDWALLFRASSVAGTGASALAQLGTKTNAQDGQESVGDSWSAFSSGNAAVGSYQPTWANDPPIWTVDKRAPMTASSTQSWTVLFWLGTGYGGTDAKLYWYNAPSVDIPETIGGTPFQYSIFVDYDPTGKYSGQKFDIDPVRDSAANDPLGIMTWSGSDIATLKMTPQAAYEGGVRLTFTAAPVPEPGSMLALGSGLVGLVGFAIRRRR